ncbi:PEP/pyruvate-binding domain-containing protein [Halocatena marina]|nr:PEP/pyruvate-binding domain-containing protein [Halocatena marina]
MSTTENEPKQFIVDLDAVDPERERFGGKGATLGALIEAGFNVPGGFCVTTDAYEILLNNEVRDAIQSLDDRSAENRTELERRTEEIRSSFRTRELPDELHSQLREAIETHGAASYAVRSSATAEDLPSASFAGQHETYLGVSPDDVADRVLDCLASLFTERAVTYRNQNNIPNADVALAVVVQRMVDAEAAGVLFTADPDSGNRTIASVDAAFGLGETIVAGEVEADNAHVEKSTGEVLSYDVGTKQIRLSLEENDPNRVTLDETEQRARVLSDDNLSDLVRLGVRIESHLESPQDIEWALVDGEFVILQSRPITALFPLPEPMPTDGRLHVYLSVGHTQAMAEAMPPLAVDLWTAVIEEMLAEFDTAGERGRWAAHAGGRVYEDITPFLRQSLFRGTIVTGLISMVEHAALGLKELTERRESEFEGGVSPSIVPSLGRDAFQLIRTVAPIIPGIVSGYCLSFIRAGEDMPHLRQWYREWGEQAATEILEPDDGEQLARTVFDGLPYDTVSLMREVYPRFMPLMAGMTAGKALKKLFPEEHATVDAAGRGSSDEVGTRMNLGLDDLEAVAHEYPAVGEALRDGRTLAEIATVDGGDAFVSELETFLEDFGHRTTGEIDVSRPRWRDDPAGVLQIVRSNLRAGDEETYRSHLRARQQAAKQAVDDLLRKAGQGVLGPLRRPLVRRLLRVYRGYIPLRDEPKQGSAHLFAAWHEGLQHAGEQLAANDQLRDPDDVWYLRKEELFELFESGAAANIDVDSRRREHERFARLDAPALLTSEGEALTTRTDQCLDGALVGTGVSSGVIEGTARVIHNPSESTLEKGEILVAPSCDPGWTPLFLNASGLVTDVGGRMTHGALVAREYGLPAVMSVSGATKRIETGQRLRVDGSRGTVERLD